MKQNVDFKNEEVYQYSYKKILENIKELFDKGDKTVIIEELFNDKNLVQKIKEFCDENNIEINWFYIERDLDKLLEIESKRERVIKNTKEDFEKLEKELDEVGIENEITIDNNRTIKDSVESILEKI